MFKSAMNYFKNVEKIRGSLDYDIDGIVYKIRDYNIQKDLVLLVRILGGQ